MSDYAYIAGGISMSFFLIFIFTLYAVSNAEINCPTTVEDIYDQFNNTGVTGVVTGTGQLIGVFFSPCSGLPWWTYIFVFLPFIIALAIFITPLIGS